MVNLLSINSRVDNLFNFTLCLTGRHKEECDRYREELNNDLITGVVLDLISFCNCSWKHREFALRIAVQRCETCFPKDSDYYKF